MKTTLPSGEIISLGQLINYLPVDPYLKTQEVALMKEQDWAIMVVSITTTKKNILQNLSGGMMVLIFSLNLEDLDFSQVCYWVGISLTNLSSKFQA